jgi:multidrug resistance efflux pump
MSDPHAALARLQSLRGWGSRAGAVRAQADLDIVARGLIKAVERAEQAEADLAAARARVAELESLATTLNREAELYRQGMWEARDQVKSLLSKKPLLTKEP